jgi:molybdate transport system substrate-binding protein
VKSISKLAAAKLGAAGLAALLLAACGSSSGGSAGSTGSAGASNASASPTSTLSGTIVVSAAASLTGSFDTIKAAFTKAHPGVTVTVSYGGSDTLAAQINAGAPVDVFASASDKTMSLVVDAGNAAAPTRFATNTLELAVPKANPAGIATLADIAKPGIKVALCAATVPCGAAATKVLAAAGLSVTPVTLETDVKSVLSKVSLGEVDAGLVYTTDVQAAGAAVKGITFPEATQAVTNYPIVVCKSAPNAPVASAFLTYVLSPAGQKVLSDAGFAAP